MAKNEIFYGRNILKEALERRLPVEALYVENANVLEYIERAIGRLDKRVKIVKNLPSSLKGVNHQGVAFQLNHSFYVDERTFDSFEPQRVLLLNHLEDPQNLGSIIRGAVAFGFDCIVHEKHRSVEVSPAVVKASSGMAFSCRFFKVSNLAPFTSKLRQDGFFSIGLGVGADLESLYGLRHTWDAPSRIALALGSEGKGLSSTLQQELDSLVTIPMVKGVESLNVAQAAVVGMSWIYQKSKFLTV